MPKRRRPHKRIRDRQKAEQEKQNAQSHLPDRADNHPPGAAGLKDKDTE